jgi:beta-lactamase regulating signal transducer with metallopeptidase domain
MMAETTLTALVRINLVASVAIVLVIALRPFVLRWLGGSVAYWFWLVVPIAAAASMLPARWFNPLAHLAAVRIRADQEIACDAAVIAARPAARRAYGQALIKTQVAPVFLRLGCTWSSRSPRRLAERISTLGRPSLSRRGAIVDDETVFIRRHR